MPCRPSPVSRSAAARGACAVASRVACALVLPDTPRNRQLVEHARGAAARYRNVGVRIEDNYILTPEGLARITDVPREIEEIEALRKNLVM